MKPSWHWNVTGKNKKVKKKLKKKERKKERKKLKSGKKEIDINMSLPNTKSLKVVGQKMFRTRTFNIDNQRPTNSGPRCVQQIRQMTWLEVRRLWSTGLSGYWALAVFLVVGHAACHITGPSVILSVILAAITSALSGKTFNFNLNNFSTG